MSKLIDQAREKMIEGGAAALDEWIKTLTQEQRDELALQTYEAAIRLDERVKAINDYLR